MGSQRSLQSSFLFVMNGCVAAWRSDDRLVSQRWANCIQLYIHFVSLFFCIFDELSSAPVIARNLPDWSANG
ncbi:hypothetical protein FQ185_26945 [Pseudomonas sp. ANT_H12B]|nr:hypothetical protein FQ185_26945 [Pseudomonas sp. ANT_H12B]